MENPLSLSREEYERAYREDTAIEIARNPPKKSDYYKGEFGPIERLPGFLRGIFSSIYLSDEAKDEFKRRVLYGNFEDGKFKNPLSGFIIFLDDHFFGISDDFEYVISLEPSYDGGCRIFQIANGGGVYYKNETTVTSKMGDGTHGKFLKNFTIDVEFGNNEYGVNKEYTYDLGACITSFPFHEYFNRMTMKFETCPVHIKNPAVKVFYYRPYIIRWNNLSPILIETTYNGANGDYLGYTIIFRKGNFKFGPEGMKYIELNKFSMPLSSESDNTLLFGMDSIQNYLSITRKVLDKFTLTILNDDGFEFEDHLKEREINVINMEEINDEKSKALQLISDSIRIRERNLVDEEKRILQESKELQQKQSEFNKNLEILKEKNSALNNLEKYLHEKEEFLKIISQKFNLTF